MMKTESFNWQRPNKICNGIKDFGLLREKPSSTEETKPNFSTIYISRAVFIVGVIAAITFIMCLVLADKYQKSVNLSHHYASFVYEKDRERLKNRTDYYYNNNNNDNDTDTDLNSLGRVRNISEKLPIEEINHLLPVTTVLRSLNVSRTGRTLADNFRNTSTQDFPKIAKKGFQSLADLLKRTELKPVVIKAEPITTSTENSMQFAQLESYRHHRNAKNLQDLLKYINCNSAANCNPKYQSEVTTEMMTEAETQIVHEPIYLQNTERIKVEPDSPDSHYFNASSNILENQESRSEAFYSNTNPPFYYASFADPQPRLNLEAFHRFRASSPLEINQLDQTENPSEQIVHRFSNRMYHRGVLEHPEIYTQELDPYLKPPTPPPTTLSFTPSYTTAIFHGFNEHENDLRSEGTALESNEQMKPISLMVEIFPANDYELPGSIFNENHLQRPKQRKEQAFGNRANNYPTWMSSKMPSFSQNRMRLFVNLFPQHTKQP